MRTRGILAALWLLALGVVPLPSVHAADDFGSAVSGEHIYDISGLFTPDQVQPLEAKAAALEQMGVPIVVYVRQQEATSDQAEAESTNLLQAWDVGSSPGAGDGFVLLIDVSPSKPRSSQIGITTGKAFSPSLTQDQLLALVAHLAQPEPAGSGLAGGVGSFLDGLTDEVVVTRALGARVAGQHVYDQADVLSPGDIQTFETKAAALDALGAPTIVVFRLQAATGAQAQRDARSILDGWAVETAPGLWDGITMVLDMVPGDTQHGQLGIYVGPGHLTSGQVTQARLQAIIDQDIQTRLANSDFVGGIGGGLDALAGALSAPTNPAQG